METTKQNSPVDIGKKLTWLAIPSELAARIKGGSQGFAAMKKYFAAKNVDLFDRLVMEVITDLSDTSTTADPSAKSIDKVLALQTEVCEKVCHLRHQGIFPLVISGDHSSAAGISAGLRKAHSDERIGIVYIDAHADLHSPYTSPSGNMHGMSLAIACGLDHINQAKNSPNPQTIELWNDLKALAGKVPAVDPQDVVFCAVRDIEKEEEQAMLEHGMVNHSVKSIRQIGIKNVVSKIINDLSHCDRIYVSFDIDSLDPDEAPGTGTPAKGGLSLKEVIELCSLLIREKKVCCWELTELNPVRDMDEKTVANACQLILAVTEELLTYY